MEMKKNIDIEASDWLGEQFQPVSEIDSGAKKNMSHESPRKTASQRPFLLCSILLEVP